MSKATAANPVCSTNNPAKVANTGISRTQNIPGEPVCRTVTGDQTTTPSPSN